MALFATEVRNFFSTAATPWEASPPILESDRPKELWCIFLGYSFFQSFCPNTAETKSYESSLEWDLIIQLLLKASPYFFTALNTSYPSGFKGTAEVFLPRWSPNHPQWLKLSVLENRQPPPSSRWLAGSLAFLPCATLFSHLLWLLPPRASQVGAKGTLPWKQVTLQHHWHQRLIVMGDERPKWIILWDHRPQEQDCISSPKAQIRERELCFSCPGWERGLAYKTLAAHKGSVFRRNQKEWPHSCLCMSQGDTAQLYVLSCAALNKIALKNLHLFWGLQALPKARLLSQARG